MGKLPQSRATYSRPFTHTGLDFAGPFDVKSYSGRACRITKGYVCVFVCFSTKAIHLEATSDLTTEKFLGAFSRFAARRGCPLHLYSDNGKTFVGAEKALTEDFIAAVKEKVTSSFSHQSLSWHFNPPGAPHMGGLWEAGVKSFKTHFYKTTAMSEDPSDILALTPGHFLIGGPLLVPAEPPTAGEASSILNRWQRLKALGQLFASRWKAEYLKEFHKRTKWQIPTRNMSEGDMVIIKEDHVPSYGWRLGRVQRVYPGSDDKVRVVDVRTARGILKRPISKLVFLPVDKHVQCLCVRCP
ncbi:uncharacterized protein LOC120321436 isoform X2 [Drosophila yakuba]|nr:uncharacterized protein LOC120321436 isoform X2 [Drosophila yakuba]